jgi:hypothetical protein
MPRNDMRGSVAQGDVRGGLTLKAAHELKDSASGLMAALKLSLPAPHDQFRDRQRVQRGQLPNQKIERRPPDAGQVKQLLGGHQGGAGEACVPVPGAQPVPNPDDPGLPPQQGLTPNRSLKRRHVTKQVHLREGRDDAGLGLHVLGQLAGPLPQPYPVLNLGVEFARGRTAIR